LKSLFVTCILVVQATTGSWYCLGGTIVVLRLLWERDICDCLHFFLYSFILFTDGEVRIGGIAHGCGFELIDFHTVAGSLASRNRSQHSRFAFLIARSHRFLPCLNCSVDTDVRRASASISHSSLSSFFHQRFARGDHHFCPNMSSRNDLNNGIKSKGDLGIESLCCCTLQFHSLRQISSSLIS
jgi:hypothetical protein